MIYWAPLLHFYQPSLQLYSVLDKVVKESYRPLIEVIRRRPYARVTVNINGALTELLWETGHADVIDGLRGLAENKQIEFTGSGKYHPILPLIPQEEMTRQVRRNHLTNRHFFGNVYAPRGFFPPEMAFSMDIVNAVVATRHDWIILSGVACPLPWPMDMVHEVSADDEKLAVFFRDDILSNRISFQDIDGKRFIEHLKGLRREDGDVYVITAMDAETFGHHIQNWEKLFLADVYEAIGPARPLYPEIKQKKVLAEQHLSILEYRGEAGAAQIKPVLISDLLDLFPRGKKCAPKPSSWSTSEQDIKAGNYYPLWKDKNNPLHILQWEHLNIAIELMYRAQEFADNPASKQYAEIARALLDPALQSDQFWWANKGSRWDINMVDRGLRQHQEVLLNAYKSIALSGCSEEQKRLYYYRVVVARDIRNKIRDRLILE
ncbi:MAG: hypothetical protein HY673_15800 [Chloroflexi bacterium]|nr:hypothetical protein [Chloroflexota bacterium]